MSVRFHEAVCFDSTKYRLDWRDDFWGDSIDARWDSTVVSGGTVSVVDSIDGGIIRLSTPTASDQAQIDWNDIRNLHVNKKVTEEAKVRANGGVTDTLRYLLTLWYDSSNHIDFYHNYDSTDIYIRCTDGGASTAVDSGINLDASFHIYRIECFPTGEVHFYIDGVECANSPITTNIPDDAGDYLQPRFWIITNADTDPATSMDIDYAYIRQER